LGLHSRIHGVLYVLADADSHIESGEGLHVIRMPKHYGALSPLLHVVSLQLLAYHTAVARGLGDTYFARSEVTWSHTPRKKPGQVRHG